MVWDFFKCIARANHKLWKNGLKLFILYFPFYFLSTLSHNPQSYLLHLSQFLHQQGLNVDWIENIPVQQLPLSLMFKSLYFCTLFLFVLEVYRQKQHPEFYKFKWPSYNNYYLLIVWVVFFLVACFFLNVFNHFFEMERASSQGDVTYSMFLIELQPFLQNLYLTFTELLTVVGLLSIIDETLVEKGQRLSLFGQESSNRYFIHDLSSFLRKFGENLIQKLKDDWLKIMLLFIAYLCLEYAVMLMLQIIYVMAYFTLEQSDYIQISLSMSTMSVWITHSLFLPLLYFILFESHFGPVDVLAISKESDQ